ncbi:kinase-like domain-containing protein [Lasiosphaeria ovina]|uniref:non-specific serine/threonine protein kinase n=1 Tax=Lasiosphaeria ovina TaxID=92902 RepID=A0AAE0MZB0_9PEZI|nr:kinase-like domain-containing protein [Lasiosphaeria ovina]
MSAARRQQRQHQRDLVRDWKLQTTFRSGSVEHVRRTPRPGTDSASWGAALFGTLWLEECLSGPARGQLRAVKEIRKGNSSSLVPGGAAVDYERELEAVVKFSQDMYFENDSAVYIAIEYIERGHLQGCLTHRFPEKDACAIASQLVDGLQFMHNNGFAHRDLKPANILILSKRPWWVKISDFGISKRIEGLTALRTMQLGTWGYIAPEVIGLIPLDGEDDDDDNNDDDDGEGVNKYTLAVDIWALGEIAFRMIAYAPSFGGPRQVRRYVVRNGPFPTAKLAARGASESCQEFTKWTMAAGASRRPTADHAAAHVWLQSLEITTDSDLPDSGESGHSGAGGALDDMNTAVSEAPSKRWSDDIDPDYDGDNSEGREKESPKTKYVAIAEIRAMERSLAIMNGRLLAFRRKALPPRPLESAWEPNDVEDSWLPEEPTIRPAPNLNHPEHQLQIHEPDTAETPDGLTLDEIHDLRHQQSALLMQQSPSPRSSYSNSGTTRLSPSPVATSTGMSPVVSGGHPPPAKKRSESSWLKKLILTPRPNKRVFGVLLRTTDGEGKFYIAGYIPIIVAKVGNFLKAKATVLLQYLYSLSEPVIPFSSYEAFREPLRNFVTEGPALTTSFPDHKPLPVIFETLFLDQNALITSYKQLALEIPPLNRQLLLYLLDTLALFADNSDKTNVPTSRLAIVFQTALLMHPQHYTSQDDIRLNQAVVIFLIENQEHFHGIQDQSFLPVTYRR